MRMRLKMLPLLALAMLSTGAASPQEGCVPGPWMVFFDPNSSAITNDAAKIVDNAIDIASLCPSMHVRVAGHSDTSERPEVAVASARAVNNYLAGRGIFVKRRHMRAFGATRLRAKTPVNTEEKQNRRVEILLLL